jgi:hypothetical protein
LSGITGSRLSCGLACWASPRLGHGVCAAGLTGRMSATRLTQRLTATGLTGRMSATRLTQCLRATGLTGGVSGPGLSRRLAHMPGPGVAATGLASRLCATG